MNITVNGTYKAQTNIDINDALVGINKSLGFHDKVRMKDGLYNCQENNYHNMDKYTLATNNEEDIKAYDCLEYLIEYVKGR